MPPNETHAPYSFDFDNELERTSLSGSVATDIGKIAIQRDNMSLWVLTSNLPTWKRLLLQGDSTLPTGTAGGDLTGSFPNPSVIGDSHNHTPGVSIPAYPTSLPPTGNAGGDLVGLYPNPQLELSGVVAGLYTNASLTIDAKGRVTGAQSNPLGEANTGQSLGPGKAIYAGKVARALTFRSLLEAPNSGLSLSITPTHINIDTPNLAKLSGATFTGPIVSPSLNVQSLVISKTFNTPIYTASYGSLSWQPDGRNGSVQLLSLNSNVSLDRIQNSYPGDRYTFFLRQPSSGNSDITYGTEYRFPQGSDKALSNSSYAMDMLEVFILSASFYSCKLYKNLS